MKKPHYVLFSIFTLIIALTFVFTGCYDRHHIPAVSTTPKDAPLITTDASSLPTPTATPTVTPLPTPSMTTPVISDFYSDLSAALNSCESMFTLTGTGDNKVDMIDIQEWMDNRDDVYDASWKSRDYGDHIDFEFNITYRQEYKLSYAYRSGDRKKLTDDERDTLANAEQVIGSVIKPGMSDYEKEKAIHDYIIITCEYDSDNYSSGTATDSAFCPYGVLISKKAVCDGYSSTFKLFMDMLDIECVITRGVADGEGHSWNLVRISGEWYWIDVTWDDPVYLDGNELPDVIRYDWFNVTDNIIGSSHQPDTTPTVKCTATKYNYFVYNDLVVSNKDELKAALQRASKQRDAYVSVLYTGSPLSNDELHSIFPSNVYMFSSDNNTGIIIVYFS